MEFVWLAAVNDKLTATFGLRYTIFLAEFHKDVERADMMEVEASSDGAFYDDATSTKKNPDKIIRDLMKIRPDSLVKSFLKAGQAMHAENRARPIADKPDNDFIEIPNLVHFLKSSQVVLLS